MSALKAETLKQWNAAIVGLLSNPLDARPGARLSSAISALIGHNLWWCIFLSRNEPAILHEYANPSDQVDHYADGPYLVDPIYISFLRGDPSGFYNMRDLVKKYPTRAARYLKYDWDLHGRIDEIGLTFDMDQDTRVVFSIGRTFDKVDPNEFSASECTLLQSLSPVIETICSSIWTSAQIGLVGQHDTRAHRHFSLNSFLDEFGRGYLTKREAEIGSLLIKGFNAKEIARLLDISDGTVRNHMKKVYAKLDVSSQAEMCGVFIEQILSDQSL